MKIPFSETPDVSTQALGAPNVETDLSGISRAGEAVASAGAAIGQIADKAVELHKQEKEKADASAVADAETQLQGNINAALYEPENGIMFKRGESALAASGQVYDNLARARQTIQDKVLTNDAQRRLFQMRTGGVLEDTHRQITHHVGQQVQVAHEATLQANQQTALTAIANDYANEEVAARQSAKVETAVRALQASPEQGDAQIAEWKAKVASTRLNQYLGNGDFAGAQSFFATARNELGPESATFEHRISVLKRQVGADQMAQRFVQDHLDDNGRPIEGAVWAEVDKQPPGEERKALEEQVQSRLSHALKAYEQAEGDRLGRVVTGIEQSGGNLDQSTDDFQRLSPANKAKALERRNTILRTDKGEQRALDKQAIDNFRGMPPDEQVGANINTQFPSASPDARDVMRRYQQYAKQKQAKGQLETLSDLHAQAKTAATGLNMPKAVAEQFTSAITGWYQQQETANGKPPSRKEVDVQMAYLLAHDKGGWFSSGTYRFQAKPGEEFTPSGDQPYAAYRDKVRGPQPPPTPIAPAPAPKGAASGRVTRTRKDGSVITWDGKRWVPGG